MRAVALNGAAATSRALVIDSPAGRLAGTWMGDGPIRAGETVDVELELAHPRAWSDVAELGSPDSEDESAAAPRVRALVERAFGDGVLLVRIGEATAQLEIVGDVPDHAVGSTVSIPTSDLEFFPTGA